MAWLTLACEQNMKQRDYSNEADETVQEGNP